MEIKKQDRPDSLSNLKAQQAKLLERIQHARRPSRVLFDMLEQTGPEDTPQHLPALANQYDALLLMRQGGQAVLGYLSERPVSTNEKDLWEKQVEGLKEQGVRMGKVLEGQEGHVAGLLGDHLEFYLEGQAEPVFTMYTIDIGDDPRFYIDDREPNPGFSLVFLQVNDLKNLNDLAVQRALDSVVAHMVVEPYVPRQFEYNSDNRPEHLSDEKMIAEIQHDKIPIEDKKNTLEKLMARVVKGGMMPEEQLEERIDEAKNVLEGLDRDMVKQEEDIKKKYAKRLAALLSTLPFSQITEIPLLMEALNGIKDRYSDSSQ